MTTEAKQPKRIEITQTHSSDWEPPADWKDWSFPDLCACNDLDAWLAKAPMIDVRCPRCGELERCNAINAAVSGEHSACDKCCDEHHRLSMEPAKAKLLEDAIASTIPPLYLATDRAKLEKETSAQQVAQALRWKPKERAKGIVLVGDTRAGKTRTLCLLLQRLLREGIGIRAFFHGSFYDELVEVMRSDRNYRRWKNEIVKAEVLVIDDLFAEKLTERGEASLFEVLDERICHYRPTFLTTQITKKEGIKRFHSAKRAEAFFARLREFFEVIPCGKPKQAEIKIDR